MTHVLVILALLAATATADPTAGRYFKAGQKAYELGDFATAAEAFREAHEVDPVPETVFSYGQALRRLYYVDLDPSLLERARVLYVAYLDRKPDGPRARHARQHVTTIDRLLVRIAAKPAGESPRTQLLVASEVATATAQIDDASPVPTPSALDVAAGPHRVTLAAPGHDAVAIEVIALDGKVVVATGNPVPRPGRLRVRSDGTTIAVDGVRLDGNETTLASGHHTVTVRRRGYRPVMRDVMLPLDGDVVVDVSLQPTTRRRVARGLFVSAGVLAGASLVGGLLAYNAQRDAVAAADLPRDLAAYEDARSARNAWRALAVGLGLGAITAAGVGTYLYYTDDAALETAPAQPRLQPVVGPDTIGVAWSF